MKKFILAALVIILHVSILAGTDADPVRYYGWDVYTNTSYLHQIEARSDSVLAATWGGVSIFQKNTEQFSVLDRNDGLLRNEVRSIHYIESLDQTWIGTLSEGISRFYQGGFLSPYQENQGIDAEIIYDICDNGDYIFIGSNSGIAMLEINETENPAFINTFTAPQWLSDNKVRSIAFDDSNRIWLATDSGINYVEISYDNMILPENWQTFTTSLTSEKITSIEYYNGKIYYGSTDGFAIIDSIYKPELDINDVEVFSGSGLPSRSISDIEVKSDSVFWVSFGEWNEEFQKFDLSKGVSRYNSTIHNWYSQDWDALDSLYEQISDIEVTENGEVWLASWRQGLYKFVEGEWENYTPNCIGTNFITDMIFDSKRNLWCISGTKSPNTTPKGVKGVSKFDGNGWINYREEPFGDERKIWSDIIFSLAERESTGEIWLGTWSDGLGILNPTTHNYRVCTKDTTEWLSTNYISFLESKEDTMWIGNYTQNGGVTVFSSETDFHQFEPYVLVEDDVTDVWAILLHEDFVWLGGYLSGIQYWQGQGLPITEPDPAGDWDSFSGSEGVTCTNFGLQENYGYIFACCEDGLYMYDEYYDSWYKFTSGMELNVKAYKWDASAWVEHYYYYDNSGTSEERLGSGKTNSVNDIFVDQHNRKWLATECGISVLDADNYTFTNFTTENSDLPNNKVKSLAYDPYKGLLYAGTQEGLCSFEIGATKKDSTFNKVVTGVKVFPNPFKPAKHDYLYFQPESGEPLPEGKNNLYIYNLAGELVVKLDESDNYRFFWDCKNIASGVYIYVLSSEYHDKQIKGKFAIIR